MQAIIYQGSFLSGCKEESIQLRPKIIGRSREMRLRRIKLKNGCHERSLIFAIQSRFKLEKIDEEKSRVPTGCILSIGTVPTGCILSVGTVPMGCILIQIQGFMLYQDSIHPPFFQYFTYQLHWGTK